MQLIYKENFIIDLKEKKSRIKMDVYEGKASWSRTGIMQGYQMVCLQAMSFFVYCGEEHMNQPTCSNSI